MSILMQNRQRPPVYTVVIGHADDADMLRRCISHHLSLGFNSVFVSLNGGDRESEDVVSEFAATADVAGLRVGDYAQSPYHFLTDAANKARQIFNPDFLLIIDSDEFCMIRQGSIADFNWDSATDVYSITRYDAPIICRDVSAAAMPADADLNTLVLALLPNHVIANLRPAVKRHSWLLTVLCPKTLSRAQLVHEVYRGGHQVELTKPDPVVRQAAAIAIVHVPFSTVDRFRRKLEKIRIRLASFQSHEALQWRDWIATADQGSVEDAARSITLRPEEAAFLMDCDLLKPVSSILEDQAAG